MCGEADTRRQQRGEQHPLAAGWEGEGRAWGFVAARTQVAVSLCTYREKGVPDVGGSGVVPFRRKIYMVEILEERKVKLRFG